MNIPKTRILQIEQPEAGLWMVRFNRPDVRNAFNTATCEDLREVFGPLAFTPGDLRCVILTGAGDQAFSAGGDLKERQGMSDDDWRLQHAIIEESAFAVLCVPKIRFSMDAGNGRGKLAA